MTRGIALFLLLCPVLAACDGLFDSSRIDSRYALDVNPPVVLENESVRIEILEDEFVLREDGTARRVATEHHDYSWAGSRDTTVTYDAEFVYRVDGTTIEFEAECPPNALCAPPPHLWGRVTADGLELHTLFDPHIVLAYRRLVP